MRYASIKYWAIATCCLLSTGCTVCQNARRTVCDEPAAYSWKHDRRRSIEAYRQLADEAWIETTGSCPELLDVADYAAGFRDGFVDYVYAGGTGEPPPVPPRHFWNVMLRSPDGKARADQWFAGYRHGARVARDGGYREFGTVDSSLVAMHPAMRGSLPIYAPPYSTAIEQQWPGDENLPEPFSPPPLILPQATPEELPINGNASDHDDSAIPAEPIHEADAFQDDPVEESAIPADEPPSTDMTSADIPASDNASTAETSVAPAIATEDENTTTQVLLTSARQPEAGAVLQVTRQTNESPAHSTARFVTSEAPTGDSLRNHTNTKLQDLPKLTLNHFRGQQSAGFKPTAAADQTSSQYDWAPAKGTTIRIQEQSNPMPTASTSGFIPFGVTFER